MTLNTPQILYAALAALGFAVIFDIRPKNYPCIFLGGALSWGVYLAAEQYLTQRAAVMFVSIAVATLYSEVAARIIRVPAQLLYTPIVIPMIPGSNLYYCIRALLTNDSRAAAVYGKYLLEDTAGIVFGSIIILSFFSALNQRKSKTEQNYRVK